MQRHVKKFRLACECSCGEWVECSQAPWGPAIGPFSCADAHIVRRTGATVVVAAAVAHVPTRARAPALGQALSRAHGAGLRWKSPIHRLALLFSARLAATLRCFACEESPKFDMPWRAAYQELVLQHNHLFNCSCLCSDSTPLRSWMCQKLCRLIPPDMGMKGNLARSFLVDSSLNIVRQICFTLALP